jgi:hypothetical protein
VSSAESNGQRAGPIFFFVHVMKTGGTTFAQHINANFQPDEIFPGPDWKPGAYFLVEQLRQLPPHRRQAIRVYAGHFPFIVSTLVGPDVTTFTLLRDPVDRTVSCLRHFKRHLDHCRDLALEEIYDDPFVFPTYVRDHQAKTFSMTLDDKLESHLDLIEVDDARLQLAKANLERVNLLGLSERYDEFVDEVGVRFGWRVGPVRNRQVSGEGWDVSPAFRQRIAADNAADVEFYEYAAAIYRRRRATRGGSGHR